jgi:hypothetical protein
MREFAPAAPISMTVLGCTLEMAKLVVACWLKITWSRCPVLIRVPGVMFVLSIMVVTGLGIYTHLIAAHVSQTVIRDELAHRSEEIESRIEGHRQALARAQAEIVARESEYAAYVAAGKVSRAVTTRQADQSALDDVRRRAEVESQAIERLQGDRLAALEALGKVTAALGPVSALARVLGVSEDRAVEIFILLVMVPFDPLSVWSGVAASHSWQLRQQKPDPKGAPVLAPVVEREKPLPKTSGDDDEVIAQGAAGAISQPAMPPRDTAPQKPLERATPLILLSSVRGFWPAKTAPKNRDAGSGAGFLPEQGVSENPEGVFDVPKNRGGRPRGVKDRAPRRRRNGGEGVAERGDRVKEAMIPAEGTGWRRPTAQA